MKTGQLSDYAIAARVFHSTTQSHATSGSFLPIVFNSENYDRGGFHSTVSNTSRLTIPYDGIYRFGATIAFASNSTGERSVRPRINGSSFLLGEVRDAVIGDDTEFTVSNSYELVTGNYIEFLMYHNAGTPINLVVGVAAWIEFVGR